MDAIAAGGGLAGAAFALELARHGARVAVVERTGGPHHKVCGDFLSDKTQGLLRHLGLDPASLEGRTLETLRLASGARQASARLPFRALGVSRMRLDQALLDVAARAGVKILRSTAVEGLADRGENVEVRTTRGTFQCRAAALASGKHNIRGQWRPTGSMVSFKIHVHPSAAATQALADTVQLIAFSGGYLGACFIEKGVLSIAWNVQREVLRSVGTNWAAQQAFLARQSGLFGDLTSGSVPVWEKPLAISGLPHGFLREQPIAPRIYPVGDQLAVLPSFVGDGTALALASGIAAAHAVLKGEPARIFQSRLVATHKPQFRWAMAINSMIASPLLLRFGLAVAGWSPRMITRIVAATRLRGFDDFSTRIREPG